MCTWTPFAPSSSITLPTIYLLRVNDDLFHFNNGLLLGSSMQFFPESFDDLHLPQHITDFGAVKVFPEDYHPDSDVARAFRQGLHARMAQSVAASVQTMGAISEASLELRLREFFKDPRQPLKINGWVLSHQRFGLGVESLLITLGV